MKEDPLHFNIEINGRLYPAKMGETVAASLISAGLVAIHLSPKGAPRGLYCGMGVCFECRVIIDGKPDQRACVTLSRPGMRIRLGTDTEAGNGTN